MFFVIAPTCFSQQKDQPQVGNVSKLTFLNPGFSFEKKTGSNQTVVGSIFMNAFAALGYSGSLGNTSKFYFDPAYSLQYRFYYNRLKRQLSGKRIEQNSLNYITPVFKSVFSRRRISSSHIIESKRRAINTIAVVWGIQRNYKTRFSLDLGLGTGYLFTKATLPDNRGEIKKERVGKFTIMGQLNLGFWLNRK